MKRNGFLISKAFGKYLLASVLTVAADKIASLVDAALVGNLIAADGLAVIITTAPVLQAYYALSCLYIPSCTMLSGIALGKGDRRKADRLFTLSVCLTLLLGVVLTFAGLFFLKPLAAMLCQSDTILPLTESYLRVIVISTIPMLLMFTLQQFVQVDGSPRTVTFSVIIGNLVNIILDIVFMKFLGWGIAGAGWATFTMYTIIVLVNLRHFLKKDTLRICLDRIWDYVSAREVVTFGIPVFLSTGLLSVQLACFNYTAATYIGSIGLIVLAACIQLLTFSMIILTGTMRTIQPVGSILCGMGDFQGMKMLIRRAYSFMAVTLIVLAGVMMLFPVQISSVLGVTGQETMPYIHQSLPAFSFYIVSLALLYNLISVYQLCRQNRVALLLSISLNVTPIFGFWFMAANTQFTVFSCHFAVNPWYGFFLGHLLTAIVLIISVEVIRHCSRHPLSPITLVPRAEYPTLEFSYGPSPDDLHQSFDGMSQWLNRQELDDEVLSRVCVIAEELMSNFTRHAEAGDRKSFADVRLAIRPDAVSFSLTDSGIPFNPIENKDKDYGPMIANGSAITIDYKYQLDQNMTTVTVRQNSSTQE